MSVADTAIIPFQDLFALPAEARMNRPGVAFGNWEWRYGSELPVSGGLSAITAQLGLYGRLNNS